MKKKVLSILLCISMVLPMLSITDLPVSAGAWTLDGNDPGWKAVYPANNQNDYLQDQQTGSGSVSQDIVGDASHPSTYMHLTDEEVAFRIRISNVNGSNPYQFKNFAFVGVDADLNGSVDLFLGVYNPTGNNGRLGIYGSNSGYANTGPSTTGISGKPRLAFKPLNNVNYAITPTGDGSQFNGDDDYFVSFKFAVSDIASALATTGLHFDTSTPFRFMTGTAAQDNAFNQDLNGMDRSGWSSKKTWNALGVFSNVVTANSNVTYHTVNFDNNTGDTEASPAFRVIEAGGKTLGTFPLPPTKRGMYFQGWNSNPDGTGDPITGNTVINRDLTAYATWSDKQVYTVTFNPNSGNWSGTTTAITMPTLNGIVGDLMPPSPTQGSKYFMGWNTSSNGSGTWFNASTLVPQNTTVYAQWSSNANKSAVFYNNFTPDGGAIVTTVYSNGNSNNFNGVLPTLTRPGYAFEGWFLNDKTGSGTPVSSISQAGNYYAKWTPAAYTVNFVANSGSEAVSNMPVSRTITDGKFGAMPPSEPVWTGYQFIEWNRNADGSGESIYPTSMITGNTTLYAIWKASRTVIFNPNGGEGGLQSITAVDEKLSYSPQPPSREGYSFLGWGTSPDADTVVDLRDMSGYSMLYAVWSPVFTVTFDANSGNWGSDAATTTDILTAYGSVLYLPDAPARANYTFSGWNTEADGTGTPFTLSTSVIQDFTRVYAIWTPVRPDKYTVSFETNGGNAIAAIETDLIDTAPVTAKDGYTLEGWYSDPGLDASSKANYPYPVASDITLYAHWIAQEVAVTFNANGGEYDGGETEAVINQTYDSKYAMPSGPPVRSGYTFASWNTQQDGHGVSITENTMVAVSVPHSVYALWTEIGNVTINYAANNTNYGTVSRASESLNPVTGTVLGAAASANSGYHFVEWQDAGGNQVSTSETFVPERVSGSYAAENYTAIFAANLSSVTLDDNGGLGGSGSVIVTYDQPMPTAAAPSREGYRFNGYYDQMSGGTQYYNADMSSAHHWDKTENDMTLYAQWSEHDVTGTVIDDETPARNVHGATIQIVKGNTQYGNTAMTDPDGRFIIYNVPAGTYNLIMTIGDKKEIIAIKVKADEPVTELGKVIFPLSNASSALKLKGIGTPAVVVGNLHPEAEDYLAEEGFQGFVKVEMSVAKTDEDTAIQNGENAVLHAIRNINTQAQDAGALIGLYLDINVDKYKRTDEILPWDFTGNITRTNGLIQITVPIPAELQGKDSYVVYRYHGSEVNVISETPNTDGEYLTLDPDEWTLTFYSRNFSVYAVAYLTQSAYTVEHYVMNADGSYPSLPTKTSPGAGLAGNVLTVSDLEDNSLTGDRGIVYAYGTVDDTRTTTAVIKADGSLVIKLYYSRQNNSYSSGPSSSSSGPNDYDIIFNGSGGFPSSVAQTVTYGSLLTKPAEPTREGYRFAGWYRTDGSEWNFGQDRVYSVVTLSAKWIEESTDSSVPALDKVNHFAYMQGYPDRTFGPGSNMTRAEVIVMFSRLLQEKMDVEPTYSSTFRDVNGTRWYANAIGYMEQYGIIKGYADGTFKPDAPVTRAEFAAISARFDKLASGESVMFVDVANNYWASDYISSGVSKGWIKGYPDGTFRPANYITRAEVVTLVNRMVERYPDRSSIDQGRDKLKHYLDMNNAYWAYYDVMEATHGHDYEKNADAELWINRN